MWTSGDTGEVMKHYDVDKQRESNISGDDSFARLYGAFETQIETALEVIIHPFYLDSKLCALDIEFDLPMVLRFGSDFTMFLVVKESFFFHGFDFAES